ncbi:hypothetical protein RND71_004866 [Anisodus tanguticus]|uniref:FAD-binding PCMH-type domain-containing protein n=1 Tax=Anisodus tanguticus TaxID=243964 RepID=A0AAE1SNZ3_9SOLA|nr:hypothetical protein RND71_004866 [Anisodus tanguticus]
MNKETRKLSKISDKVRTEIEGNFADSPPVLAWGQQEPRWSALDVNQHVNNVKDIAWILENGNSNFYVYPTRDESTASNYFNLLDFSIQNLRFAASFMPKPTVIIVPASKEQLVTSVLCSRRGSYEIRVRCGGHSYEGTSSVSVDGSPFVVIDLMKLDGVSVDLGSETAWVQGGATLGQTYYAISQLDDEFYLSVSIIAVSGGKTPTEINAQFNGFYLGPRTEAISVLNVAFPELGVLKHDCKEMSWIESTLFFSDLDNAENSSYVSLLKERYFEKKTYFKAKSDYVKTPIAVDGIMATLDVLEKEPKGLIILDPYGGAMQRISEEAIAFPHRKGNLFGIQYLVQWKEKDNIGKSNEYIEWIREFYNTMAPLVSSAPRAAYVNYMDLDLGEMDYLLLNTTTSTNHAVERAKVWGEKYFLNNYDRLVKAKTTIDPLNVFRHQQGIPPMFAYMQDHNYSSSK